MQEKRLWVVTNESSREVNGAVFFDARGFRLADNFDVHIRGRRGVKLSIAGHERDLQHKGVTGNNSDNLARNFRKFQPAGREPS